MAVAAPPAGRDERLVRRVLDGDRHSFAALLRNHDGQMRSLASKLLGGDQYRMDDALQEAYVKAYRSLPNFRGDSAFSTWLYRIVHNACMDELRRGAHWPEPVDMASVGGFPASPTAGPERATTTTDAVRRALDTLTPEQRAAVVLVDGQGLDVNAAAEILGVAPGTVGSRLSRARSLLRHYLREDES